MTAEGEDKNADGKPLRPAKRLGAKGANFALAPVVNATIGRRLEAHYRALTDEPLPDRFMVLLAELRAKEVKK